MSIEFDDLQEILTIKRRRLKHLRRQAAQYGYDCPAQTLMEIEDLQAEIADLQAQITPLLPPAPPTIQIQDTSRVTLLPVIPPLLQALDEALTEANLPRAITLPQRKGAVRSPDSDERTGPLVLVVEKETEFFVFMYRVMRDLWDRYTIVAAHDPVALLEQVKGRDIRLVITDYLLPERKSGVTFAKEIKKLFPQTVVMLRTAFDVETVYQTCKEAGIEHYVPKEMPLYKQEELVRSILA